MSVVVGTVVTAAEEAPVGRIVITTNMSLDGVVQDPDGGEGFERDRRIAKWRWVMRRQVPA